MRWSDEESLESGRCLVCIGGVKSQNIRVSLSLSFSVDMWHIDGHSGRLLRHPVSFRAHCGVQTFLVLSVIHD